MSASASSASGFVAANGHWDVRASLATLTAHLIPGVERLDAEAGRLIRVVTLDGKDLVLEVALGQRGVRWTTDRAADPEAAARFVAWWFDLASEVTLSDAQFAADPVLGAQVVARPGVRITRFTGGFEAAISTVLGQQVSLAAARLFTGRLVEAFGEPVGDELRAFPRAERVAAAGPERLREVVGLTGARARTAHAVAELFADGYELPIGAAAADLAELAALSGIGPWTLDYLAIRATNERDAFPASDAVLRRMLGGAKAAEVTRQSEIWSPHRSYAAGRLWAAAAAAAS